MALSPDPTVPDIIYLDEEAIDDIFSYLGHGTVNEIVERMSSETEDTAEGGLNKVLVARLGTHSIEGEETEFVRELDPIGKFAMMREALRAEDMLNTLDDGLSEEERDDLDRGNIVEFDTGLLRTPIKEIENLIDKYLEFADTVEDFVEIDEDDVSVAEEAQEMISALSREGEILRARVDEESEFNFVLTYEEENFRNRGMGFPREGANYTLVGQVTMKFSEGDEISLINFVDMASRVVDNPRQTQRKVAELKREFAKSASQFTGRDVETSEFEISYPDVQLKPLAIYQ